MSNKACKLKFVLLISIQNLNQNVKLDSELTGILLNLNTIIKSKNFVKPYKQAR